MAKIIDVPTSGKIGLTVTYPSRYGLVRRAWVSPTNPQTGSQLTARSRLASVTSMWATLTELQRQAWISLAAQLQTHPVLGQSGPLTGAQLFTKVNASLLAIGSATVSDPPAVPTIDPLPISALVITNTAGTIALKLTTTGSPPDGCMLRGAAPQSAGTYRPITMRFLGTLDSPVGSEIVITTPYTTRFGVPTVGTKVFVQVNANIDGYQGPRLTYSATVPASA